MKKMNDSKKKRNQRIQPKEINELKKEKKLMK